MPTEGEHRSLEKAVQPGDGVSKDGTLGQVAGRDGSTEHRLYDLLDTLVPLSV